MTRLKSIIEGMSRMKNNGPEVDVLVVEARSLHLAMRRDRTPHQQKAIVCIFSDFRCHMCPILCVSKLEGKHFMSLWGRRHSKVKSNTWIDDAGPIIIIIIIQETVMLTGFTFTAFLGKIFVVNVLAS